MKAYSPPLLSIVSSSSGLNFKLFESVCLTGTGVALFSCSLLLSAHLLKRADAEVNGLATLFLESDKLGFESTLLWSETGALLSSRTTEDC